jgi:hypothetical protein
MINYDNLSLQFNELLLKVTKEEFEKWKVMDDIRILCAQLKNGEKVTITNQSQLSEVNNVQYEKPTDNVGFLFMDNLLCLYYGIGKKQSNYIV